ncbi:SAM-dependent methyltransferase [Nonomuraea sp. 3-1Str]|uniref:SAM-dependent methyltransferase n=1 Tax=Nonomuraea sp. 3-1Str TaxID=2929801 RepID=UPI00285621F3|nr:SAM-dependent methyltransferase [Nonomuraea sp. 3-1Str]MDR8409892.1 SAM-dependent methyltransferase [Nonomuraea sp. 3-1Str]
MDDQSARSAWDRVDTTKPHSARVWDYLLGGKNNYAVDKQAGDTILTLFPAFAEVARLQRRFLNRAVRFLAGQAGIRQFLDIGTGLPTANNTHEVAQSVAPDSRVVYVDNDPLVLVHARALLAGTPEGVTEYIDADVRDPQRILEGAAKVLDLSRPVGLTMLSIMGQVPDADDPDGIVRQLLDGLPPGSYLALSDGTNGNPALVTAVESYNSRAAYPYHLRAPERVAAFFEGLDMVEPGVVPTPLWRPDAESVNPSDPVSAVCGVGRKA